MYYGFEHIAKGKANKSIQKKEINKLIKSFHNNDCWTIHRLFETTTLFLHTEEQVHKYKNSSIFKEWIDMYFKILKKYDEFDYFKRDNFKVIVDSKEYFDKRKEIQLLTL